jgi:MFS family permease
LNASGASLGGLLLVPLAMYLLQATSWRVSWAVLGMMVIVLAVPLGLFFLRDDPAEMGLLPDGDSEVPNPSDNKKGFKEGLRGPLEVDRWQDSLRSLPIWQLSGAYFVCGATTSMLGVHFVPYAIGQGISPTIAASAFGFMMFLNILGGTGAGILSDRFSRKNMLAAVYFLRGCAYMLLLTIPGTASLWAFASVAGFSWIATVPLTTSLTADVYGLRKLGTISGLTFLAHQVGGAVSTLMAGYLFDLTGSYSLPFAIAGGLLFPAALISFTIQEKKFSQRYQTAPAPAVGSTD